MHLYSGNSAVIKDIHDILEVKREKQKTKNLVQF